MRWRNVDKRFRHFFCMFGKIIIDIERFTETKYKYE